MAFASLGTSTSWDTQPAWTVDDEHRVRIKHLPKQMRTHAMLEVSLEQAGIDTDMKDCEFTSNGEVVVSFGSAMAAKTCVRHFNGRRWSGPSAVVACVETSSFGNSVAKIAAKIDAYSSLSEYATFDKSLFPESFRPPPGLPTPPQLLQSFGGSQENASKETGTALKAPWKIQVAYACGPSSQMHDEDSTDAGSSDE